MEKYPMTPTIIDDEITITQPFQKWVEDLVEKTVSKAVKHVSESCPHKKTICAAEKFMEIWNKRWYVGLGIVLTISTIGGLIGSFIKISLN
jgi:hypothetical protein